MIQSSKHIQEYGLVLNPKMCGTKTGMFGGSHDQEIIPKKTLHYNYLMITKKLTEMHKSKPENH